MSRLILRYLAYAAGIYIACTLQDWLFGVLFSIVSLSAALNEFANYSECVLYAGLVYLLAMFSVNHAIEIAYMVLAYVIISDKFGYIKNLNTEKIMPYLLSLLYLVLFQFNGYIVIALYVIYLIKKYDPRVLIGCAIVLLTFSAYLLTMSNSSAANTVAIYSYYFLVLGVFAELIYEFRHSESCENAVS